MEISVKSASQDRTKRMERQIVDVHYSWICSPRKSYESMEMDIKTTRVTDSSLKRGKGWPEFYTEAKCRMPAFNVEMWLEHRAREALLFYCMLVTQSCPTLCDPTDCNPPSRHLNWVRHGLLIRILRLSIGWPGFPVHHQGELMICCGFQFIGIEGEFDDW